MAKGKGQLHMSAADLFAVGFEALATDRRRLVDRCGRAAQREMIGDLRVALGNGFDAQFATLAQGGHDAGIVGIVCEGFASHAKQRPGS